MIYHTLKILHITSATFLLTIIIYTIRLWLLSKTTNKLSECAEKTQTQAWALFIPLAIFQLASGFTMISLKQYELSEFWIIGSIGGFLVLIVSWFSFLYLVFASALSKKNNLYQKLQITLLMVSGITLLFMIFLMANKIP